VLVNPKWQQAALLANLAGTVLLFYSFQATSSDFRLVTVPSEIFSDQKQYALCVNNYVIISSDGRNGVLFGHAGCPSWDNAKPAAVVNIEHPFFEGLGFFLLISGFALQYFSVPQVATVSYYRRQLKEAKLKEKLNKRKDTAS
jgi:hypothetical protein